MKKNLPDRYFYPAVFIYEDGQEIAVDFPDLGVATSGTSEDDALLSARELLGCVMCGLDKGRHPEPVGDEPRSDGAELERRPGKQVGYWDK